MITLSQPHMKQDNKIYKMEQIKILKQMKIMEIPILNFKIMNLIQYDSKIFIKFLLKILL